MITTLQAISTMASIRIIIVPFIQLFTIFSILGGNSVKAQEGFFFSIPKNLHEGDTATFCLTSYSSNEDGHNVTVSIINRRDPAIFVEVTDVYIHGEQKCTNFLVPEAESYEVLLHNETDILHDTAEVTVRRHSMVTLIQTDKPMYKPGQMVKFRILAMHSNWKARVGQISAIYIKNPDNSRVKQYLDVKSQGLASLEYQLNKEAKIGRWQILVYLNDSDPNGQEDSTVTFEVKEYVLPKFEVTVTPPAYVLPTDEIIEGKICAKYTYGKDVQGFLDLSLCDDTSLGYFSIPDQCTLIFVPINGCYNFSVNATELGSVGTSYWRLKIEASVTELGTGVMMKSSHVGPSVTTKQVNLELEDLTNGFFKPGIPFHGKVVATKPDGSPAAGELISVTAYDYDQDVRYSGNYTTDEAGVLYYALCGEINGNLSTLSIMAEALNYSDPPKGMTTPIVHGSIKQWFSPSLSYIEIPRSERKLKCGKNLTLRIPFTTQANTSTEFLFKVISKGQIMTADTVMYSFDRDHAQHSLAHPLESNCLALDPISNTQKTPSSSGPFQPPPAGAFYMPVMPRPMEPIREPITRSSFVADTVSSFTVDIPVSSTLSPKFSLLVHHVLSDGEVVADSMEFDVEHCSDNEVKMTFNKKTVLPGGDVNIRLEAEPGSVCGVGIIDKSINLLGGNHQITMEKIFEKIEKSTNGHTSVVSFRSDRDYCKERLENLFQDERYMDMFPMFVDANEAFKSTGLITITNLKINTRPCQASFPFVYDFGPRPFPLSGQGPVGMPGPGGMPEPMPVAVPMISRREMPKADAVRSHFPETWLWDLQVVGTNGSIDLPQVAPHTITNWVGNALCMDADKGAGVSPVQSLTTFQPFFIHLNLPYAAVRGERLPILFTIHNHLDKCLHMQIRLSMGTSFKIHNSARFKEPFCVCGGKSYTAKFYATPLEIGSLPIVAKARVKPGTCNKTLDVDLTYVGLTDAVERHMLVKAEGVTEEYTRTLYMCAKENETLMEDVILPLPEDIVKGSSRGDVTVIGDIMGPALTNLDRLVRMPTGCGEQNMVGFTPNIFALKYLSGTGLLTEEIHDKAVRFMEIGYQRELNYRHRDGSFSAFGKNDERGSVWLTAFVLKSFAQATKYIFIDPNDMAQTIRFLKLSQAENGCYIETGKVVSSYMMGGLGKDGFQSTKIALTSYVLAALLHAGVNSSEPVITKGFECINKEFESVEGNVDAYSLALWAYASTLDEPITRESTKLIQLLGETAKNDGALKFWSRDGVEPPPSNSYYYFKAPSAEVEMTAYALMAYLTYYGKGAVPHSHDIAMWLSQQRNSYGGFASTQDTVVGLNALSEFAELAYDDRSLNVSVTVLGRNIEKTFQTSEEDDTKLLLQKAQISTLPNRISISAAGEGCALVQANVRFNKLPQDIGSHKPGFHLKVMTRRFRHDEDKCNRRTLNIVVGSRGQSLKHSAGMNLVVIKMVTSWTPVKESLLRLKSLSPTLGLNRIDYDDQENEVTLYFDQFGKRHEFALDVEQERDLAVRNAKAGQVSVINFYETDVALVKSYTLTTTCGTKAEIPRKRYPVIDTRNPIPVQERIEIEPLFPLPRPNAPGLPTRLAPPSIPDFVAALPPLPAAPSPPTPTRFTFKPAPSPDAPKCPVCRTIKSIPLGFKHIVCNATHIYKTVAGRTGNNPLKLKQDLRGAKRKNVNKFANFTLPEGCKCDLLESPVKKVLIMTSAVLKDKMLRLDGESAITFSTKRMDKELRKLKKKC